MTAPIELRHLRHFIALAEELHFGRAARRCHISQPPFSVSIRQLERALGLALVHRSTHEVRLTHAGVAYYEDALKVMAQLERAQASATLVDRGLQGALDVGFFASMLYRGLDDAVRCFRQAHPAVALRLIELSTSDQIPALQHRRIHYGFVHTATLPADVASEELLSEPFVLCLPRTHPKAARKRVSLADVAHEDFVLFSRAFSPAYFDQVIALCAAAGFHPEVRHEARHWLTVLACVSRGLGVTVAPRSLRRSSFTDLVFVDLTERPVRSIVRGAWLHGEAANPALQAWHQVARREIRA